MGELERLMEGNGRYLSAPSQKDFVKMRSETANGQSPFAIVLTCSDSRVPPEHIFDAGIGEIFVVRTAGNALDSIALASIEYAAEHLHCPLIAVMGHEKCGAVKAAWEAGEAPAPTKSLAKLMKAIAPSVGKAKKKGADMESAANFNIKAQMRAILRKSPICKHLASEGKLTVVGLKYSIESGKVEQVK
jgi:carbonic anhydrase